MLNGLQLNDTLKQIFWKLPLSSDFKERLRSKRYERILEREAASDSALANVTDDAALLSDYASYVLDSYGKRAEGYREYQELGPLKSDVLLVAYYLTQFHPNPENDAWWGRGTTEWNNVDRAVPQFVGHYQPRRPGELGYYDLRIKDTFRRQIEIAKNYGVGAFCFYYYWFDGGKRLLDFPLNEFLTDSSLDMPFFYCWANENWTRRFSGTDNDVLMRITPTVENYFGFMRTAARDFSDARYLRIGGSPVVQVYRPSLIPEPKRVVAGWRDIARRSAAATSISLPCRNATRRLTGLPSGSTPRASFSPSRYSTSAGTSPTR